MLSRKATSVNSRHLIHFTRRVSRLPSCTAKHEKNRDRMRTTTSQLINPLSNINKTLPSRTPSTALLRHHRQQPTDLHHSHTETEMKISTVVLLAASVLAPLAEAQGRCYYIRNYGWRARCQPCRQGYRFTGMGDCNPRWQCCRGFCCRRRSGDDVSYPLGG